MDRILMKMVGCTKRIVAPRPYVGEYIRDAGEEFHVDKITVRSGGKIIEASVTPRIHISEYDLFHEFGWEES